VRFRYYGLFRHSPLSVTTLAVEPHRYHSPPSYIYFRPIKSPISTFICDSMATQKGSTFEDMTGPSEVNKSRAEGLHADNGCWVETATEVVSETALVEDASPVLTNATAQWSKQSGPRNCSLMQPCTDLAHRLFHVLLHVPLHQKLCTPPRSCNASFSISPAPISSSRSMQLMCSTTAPSTHPTYRKPCACAPVSNFNHKATKCTG
jgi:hypothetical protein